MKQTIAKVVSDGFDCGSECTSLRWADVEAESYAMDAELDMMRARLAALEAFAEEVRKAHAEAFSFEHWAAWISDALAKLPVKP